MTVRIVKEPAESLYEIVKFTLDRLALVAIQRSLDKDELKQLEILLKIDMEALKAFKNTPERDLPKDKGELLRLALGSKKKKI